MVWATGSMGQKVSGALQLDCLQLFSSDAEALLEAPGRFANSPGFTGTWHKCSKFSAPGTYLGPPHPKGMQLMVHDSIQWSPIPLGLSFVLVFKSLYVFWGTKTGK
jgi:hypothetical protein